MPSRRRFSEHFRLRSFPPSARGLTARFHPPSSRHFRRHSLPICLHSRRRLSLSSQRSTKRYAKLDYWKLVKLTREKLYLGWTFWWSCGTFGDTVLTHFNEIHFLWIYLSSGEGKKKENQWEIKFKRQRQSVLNTRTSTTWKTFQRTFDGFNEILAFFPGRFWSVCVYFLHFSQAFESCHKNRHFTCFCLNFSRFARRLPNFWKVFCRQSHG